MTGLFLLWFAFVILVGTLPITHISPSRLFKSAIEAKLFRSPQHGCPIELSSQPVDCGNYSDQILKRSKFKHKSRFDPITVRFLISESGRLFGSSLMTYLAVFSGFYWRFAQVFAANAVARRASIPTSVDHIEFYAVHSTSMWTVA